MEPGALELQIFVSLAAILGVALVALVCDFLKGHNERLREQNIELRTRREEQERNPAPRPLETVELLKTLIEAVKDTRAPAAAPAPPPARPRYEPARPEPAADLPATTRVKAPKPRGDTPAGYGAVRRPAPILEQNLPEWIRREKEERAARILAVTAAQPPEAPPTDDPGWDFRTLLDRLGPPPEAARLPGADLDHLDIEPSAPVTATAPPGAQAPVTTPAPPVDAGEQAVNGKPLASPVLPAGLQDRGTLAQLMRANPRVAGVILAIGLEEAGRPGEEAAPGSSALTEPLEGLIASLLGANDFACRSSDEEFIVVCQNESGAAAQRRLNAISEKLWDFQLRSLTHRSVLISWGAVEVLDEPFADAVASASERMHQTRRSRKTVSFDQARRRRAVNL